MGYFFTLFLAFIILSVILSEKDRKRREAIKKMRRPPVEETFNPDNFKVPEPATAPQDNTYYGEDVPRTTKAAVQEEKKTAGKELDLDPEKMIIYSEILKPKF
ncbi:MAG: hypothetical protein J5639_06355 [Bacteroidales bacterium]|nr:hypothetical protein [Bacteroidales bacterium]